METFSALLALCVGTGHRWIPLTKASDAKLWCFIWSAAEQTVEQTIKTPAIWGAMELFNIETSVEVMAIFNGRWTRSVTS